MRIWLDDVRRPPDDSWTWIRNPADFREVLEGERPIYEISFDHDLGYVEFGGQEITGYTCLCWIEKRALHDSDFPIPRMLVHSANPVGRMKMQKVIDKLHELRQIDFDHYEGRVTEGR